MAAGTVLFFALLAVLCWSLRPRNPAASLSSDDVTVSVTNPGDLGPGSLREALYIAASAKGRASVRIRTRKVTLMNPLPPLMNPHGMQLVADPAGAEIDAQALAGGAVLDVVGPNTTIEGVVVRNCAGAAVLLRAAHFHMHGSVIDSCDVGVDVATNVAGVLLDENRFANDRIGVRFAAANREVAVIRNTFHGARAAGLWVVSGQVDGAHGGDPPPAIGVRDNRFSGNYGGIVAGNIPIVVERNEFNGDGPEASVHLVGGGAVIRNNRIQGAAAEGIVAENAPDALIEGNELMGLTSYAVLLRGSANAMVRANRISDCASGLAFVLGDPAHPSSAVGNTIAEPRRNAIDVIGDSPVLESNQVLRPHALALRVTDYTQADGQRVRAQPRLQGNNFRANTLGEVVAAGPVSPPRAEHD